MSFLLKIVEGPMKGAEIALVEGLRVRVGSGENSDIVLADASLPETAFELDVSADAVSLIRGEDVRTLVPFEVFESGMSGFAIGPSEGAWEPLKRASEATGEGERTDESLASGEDAASPEKTGLGAPATAGDSSIIAKGEATSSSLDKDETSSSDAAGTPRRWASAFLNHRILIACSGALAVLLIAVAVLWIFWSRAGWFGNESAPIAAEPKTTLADIARQYGLVLTNYTVTTPHPSLSTIHYPLLKGNLARKTERMAIRSLALAENSQVRLELTDDETLHAAASELLFVVTEGAIKVASATNCVVTLVGYAPSVSSLERTIRALDADVKGIRKVVASGVTVGGPAPVATVAAVTGEKPMVFPEARPVKKAARARGTASVSPVRDYPIAGILTKPYPMVVMNNGMRLIEGAQIADVIVERIEADKLILKSGSTTFEWKP